MAMIECRECKKQISSQAANCPNCGAPISNRTLIHPKNYILISGVIAVIVLFVVISGGNYFGAFRSITDSNGGMSLPQTAFASPPIVTMSEFNQLYEGMSYEQAKAVIGASGEVMSSSNIADIKTIMYSWINSNGSNMNAMFQNGKMTMKAQFGLP